MIFNQYPYINENDLNLDYILRKIREITATIEQFINAETLKFADPIVWNISKQYGKGTIVLNDSGDAYLSKSAVPVGVELDDDRYWLEIFNFADYVRTANGNLTINIEQNTTRASRNYVVGDWVVWNDVLYEATTPIAFDELLVSGTNLGHFTVENFIKEFMQQATNIINQYKREIDASELAHKNEVQSEINRILAGATVDSEVIDARLGYNGVNYTTLGQALRTQFGDLVTAMHYNNLVYFDWVRNKAIRYDTGNETNSTNFKCTGYIPIGEKGDALARIMTITVPVYESTGGSQTLFGIAFYTANNSYIRGYQMPAPRDSINTYEIAKIIVPANATQFRATWYNDNYSEYTPTAQFSYKVKPANGANKIILGQEEINDFYRLGVDGELHETSFFGVTSFIPCHGAVALEISMIVSPTPTDGINNALCFYAEDKTTIIETIEQDIGPRRYTRKVIAVPDNAYYFRCSGFNFDAKEQYGYGDFYCRFQTDEYSKFRPYQSGYYFFSPIVNQSINKYWDSQLATELEYSPKSTTSVIYLPSNYDPNGKPVPVIMYFHGYDHYVYYDHWGDDAAFRTQKDQFVAAGFAVIDCNGARNNNKIGRFTSGGSLQYSDGYHQTFEYVKKYYNVEHYCHVVGVSAGGIGAINYAYWFNDIKSLLLLSAWTDLRVNSYDNNVYDTMIEYLGCDFSNGYDLDRTIGFDPSLKIITIANTEYLTELKVPTKAVLASADQNNHIGTCLSRFISALRNAGRSASMRIVSGTTHKDVCSSDNIELNSEYINWFRSVS